METIDVTATINGDVVIRTQMNGRWIAHTDDQRCFVCLEDVSVRAKIRLTEPALLKMHFQIDWKTMCNLDPDYFHGGVGPTKTIVGETHKLPKGFQEFGFKFVSGNSVFTMFRSAEEAEEAEDD